MRKRRERRKAVTFLPVLSLCSSRSEEVLSVVYSVSAAVPAPQQLVRERIEDGDGKVYEER